MGCPDKQNDRCLIDTHTHLNFPQYDKDRDDVIKRAFEGFVAAIVEIGSGEGLASNTRAVKMAEEHDDIFAAVGIHPNDAEAADLDSVIGEIKKLASSSKVVAIGEIGLDYYHETTPRNLQKKAYIKQLELADELKLPVSLHIRDAHEDNLQILREARGMLNGGVFHCFSGDLNTALEAVQMGFCISIPGVITFKNDALFKEIVKNVKIENIVLETDSPYLAPVPFRGKRNEPLYIKYIAEEIAKILDLSFEDVARITTENARRIFRLPGFVPEGKIAYPIRKSLYINLTNRCTIGCTFCPKRTGKLEVKGYNLKLAKEPSVEDVFRAVGQYNDYDEIVFCGFGESTLRLEIMKTLAEKFKKDGAWVRLDTDGLANLVHGRNVLPELKGKIDAASISLNAPDPETYVKLCPSKYGADAFHAVIAFIKEAKKYIPDVTASVVGVPGVDIEACRKLAEEMGVKFRLREYQELG